MRYDIVLEGETALIFHNANAHLDKYDPRNIEKAKVVAKKGSNRTSADDAYERELSCRLGLYLADGKVIVPVGMIRSCIEMAARKFRQGPQVREGLTVLSTEFVYDTERYGTTELEIGKKAQFTCAVKQGQVRILRTRPRFETPWSVAAKLDCDDELVDGEQLDRWLEVAGRRVGIGDWRPEKSGMHGRFTARITGQRD